MAFPTTPILDNFNRADSGPPAGPNWTTPAGYTGWKVLSNLCAPSAGTAVSYAGYWNVSNFGPDCEAYITWTTRGGTNDEVDLWLRADTALSGTGYFCEFFGASNVRVYKNGTETAPNLILSLTQAISSGDGLGFSAVGSLLTVWYKPSAGSWTSIGSVTDTTHTGSGTIGITGWTGTDTNQRMDDFGGGTIYPAPISWVKA